MNGVTFTDEQRAVLARMMEGQHLGAIASTARDICGAMIEEAAIIFFRCCGVEDEAESCLLDIIRDARDQARDERSGQPLRE